MRKMLFAICILLVAVSASFAATPTDASLKGAYSVQLSSAHWDWWNASITCPNPAGGDYTLTFGGSNVSNQSMLGVITFDGKGHVTGSGMSYGKFDQAASIATVVPSCAQGGGSNGYEVFDPPSAGTLTGTYSIESTGSGTMTLTLSPTDTPSFVLQLAGTGAVRNAVFLTEFDSDNQMETSGFAILQ